MGGAKWRTEALTQQEPGSPEWTATIAGDDIRPPEVLFRIVALDSWGQPNMHGPPIPLAVDPWASPDQESPQIVHQALPGPLPDGNIGEIRAFVTDNRSVLGAVTLHILDAQGNNFE
ncbi:MAG: hypothetical protein ACI9MR_002757 [Myxococcota bacterium]